MQDAQLCAVVTGRTIEELRRNRDAVTGADLVELRLDGLDRPDPEAALSGRRLPAICTCRPVWEGGAFDGPEEVRHGILRRALDGGAEFIDVEARADFSQELIRARDGRGIVLSFHAFDGIPVDLEDRWHALCGSGAEVAKLAAAAGSLDDTRRIMALAGTRTAGGQADGRRGHVLIAMGDAGAATRVLAGRLGNRWTYAGAAVAPGQLPADRLLTEFRYRTLRADTAIYGVTGNPVMHSRSPAMHNAGFARLGIDAVYLPLQAADAADFVRFARALPLAGASITAPFKVPLMDVMDEIDPLARRVGAINTLVVREGRWVGANTDVHGFTAPLTRRVSVRGRRAAILGAGGSARAVAVALADLGADVTVCARRPEAARELAALAGGSVGTFPPPPGSWDILVNTTPAAAGGGNPMAGVPLEGEVVFDLIYTPPETPLLQAARAAGCVTIGGLEMLAAQAERQFELWTGQAPPAGLFAQAAGVDRR